MWKNLIDSMKATIHAILFKKNVKIHYLQSEVVSK